MSESDEFSFSLAMYLLLSVSGLKGKTSFTTKNWTKEGK